MDIVIQKTKEDAALLTAKVIARELQKKPSTVFGLDASESLKAVYEKLVRMHHENSLDFSLALSYNLYEYIGVRPDDENSCRRYMNENLFNKVNIDLRNTHLPLGYVGDIQKECMMYDESIGNCGGIDLQLMGIGVNGHIGANEPLSAFRSRTREKALTPNTLANLHVGYSSDKMPSRAITMGVGTILEAKRLIVYVVGEERAEALAKAVEGPLTAMVAASMVQLHPWCTVIVDEAAAKLLKEKDYYYWIFQNEPEWEEFRNIGN
jgi:glucosamine-6-phosphate deaminase